MERFFKGIIVGLGGVAPAFLMYCMGVDSIFGILILCLYCICAVIRLAFFNVQEAKRQQIESGSNKFYRGLPVTSISIIFPVFYLLKRILPAAVFQAGLHILPAVVAFLFIWDKPVKKPDLTKLLSR